jgi:hypothetical protein
VRDVDGDGLDDMLVPISYYLHSYVPPPEQRKEEHVRREREK